MTTPPPNTLLDSLAEELFQVQHHTLLRAIVDNISEGVVIANATGELLYLNPAAHRLHVLASMDSTQDLRNQDYGLFHSDTLQPIPPEELPVSRALRGEEAPTATLLMRNAQVPLGLYIAITGKPLRDREGKILGAMVFVRDVTQERQTAARQRLSEERFRLIVEAAQEGIWTLDAEGHTTYVNHFMARMLGYIPDEMLGRHVLSFSDEEGRGIIAQSLELRRKGVRQVHERRFLHRNGTSVWALVSSNPLVDELGRYIGALAMVTDISHRRQAEHQVRQLNEQLEQRIAERTAQLEFSNRELEAFAYSVAHDLRAPLRSISNFTLALTEDCVGQLDATGLDYLQRIRASSQRMSELIDGILALSRINRTGFKAAEVNLSSLARALSEQLQRWQPERSVHFHLQEGLVDRGDPELLRLMLENLLGNAWKFTRQRAVAEIGFGVLPDSGSGRVYFVKDNGAGFDMAFQDKLFGVFQRLHTQQEFEGNGVGLATVQRILRRHGGRIWGEGRVDQGATFFFTLHEPAVSAATTGSPTQNPGDAPHV
jgi:PAS domain S-box-containing protein